MLENLDGRTLVAVGIALLTFSAGWGVIVAQIRGIHSRLDRINGRLDSHGHRLDDQGQRVSRMEGRQEQS